MNIEGLKFVEKNASNPPHPHSNIDVSVTYQPKYKMWRISFGNTAYTIMNRPTGLLFAYSDDKLYLLEAALPKGFLVYHDKSVKTPARSFIKFNGNLLALKTECIGFYDLKWDQRREIYYIDFAKKIGAFDAIR